MQMQEDDKHMNHRVPLQFVAGYCAKSDGVNLRNSAFRTIESRRERCEPIDLIYFQFDVRHLIQIRFPAYLNRQSGLLFAAKMFVDIIVFA